MMSFFSGFPRRILLIYALIISLLGAYAWKLKSDQNQRLILFAECLRNQKYMKETALKDVLESVGNIHNKSDAYRNEFNEVRRRQAMLVEKFCEENLQSTKEAIHDYCPDSLNNSALNSTEYTFRGNKILSHLRVAVDSLRKIMELDSLSSNNLNQIFSKKQLEDAERALEQVSNVEKSLLLSSLSFGLLGVSSDIARQIDYQIPDWEDWIDSFMPMLICNNNCIRAGEYFEAEFFAYPYSSQSENFQLFVNSHAVLFDHGIGHIKKVYLEPGSKKIMVEVRAPTTSFERCETYFKKEFTFNICD